MAIRRTREDKLQAKMRREEGKYSWNPVEGKAGENPEKPTKISVKKDQPEAEKFFWNDLRRTLVSVLVVVALLLVAWYLLSK